MTKDDLLKVGFDLQNKGITTATISIVLTLESNGNVVEENDTLTVSLIVSNTRLQITDTIIRVGMQSKLALQLSGVEDQINGYQFDLVFDSNLVSIAGVNSVGTLSDGSGAILQTNEVSPGRFRMAWLASSSITTGGVLLNLVVDGKAEGTVHMQFEEVIFSDFQANTIPVIPESRDLSVTNVIPGDVDLDDSVSVTDVVLMLQYIVGIITLTDAQKLAADFNSDGNINITDAVLMLRSIVGGKTLARLEDVSGHARWGMALEEGAGVRLSLVLEEASNVYGLELRVELPAGVALGGVEVPEGWLEAHRVEDGRLHLAAAGLREARGEVVVLHLRGKGVRGLAGEVVLNGLRREVLVCPRPSHSRVCTRIRCRVRQPYGMRLPRGRRYAWSSTI